MCNHTGYDNSNYYVLSLYNMPGTVMPYFFSQPRRKTKTKK